MRRLNRFERGIEDLHGPGLFRARRVHMDIVEEMPVGLSPLGALVVGGLGLFWTIVFGVIAIAMAVVIVIAVWSLIFG